MVQNFYFHVQNQTSGITIFFENYNQRTQHSFPFQPTFKQYIIKCAYQRQDFRQGSPPAFNILKITPEKPFGLSFFRLFVVHTGLL